MLEEHHPDVVRLLDLKIGKCRVCVGIKEGEELNLNAPELKIATKMPHISRNYFIAQRDRKSVV